MPSKSWKPESLIDLPDVENSDLLRMLKREFLVAMVPFILLAGGSYIATHRLPAGKAFVLKSRGTGNVYEIALTVVMLALFGAFYMFPSLWVRRSISIIYRIVLLLIVTAGLFWLESRQYIAVVHSGESFTFIRSFPFGSTTVVAKNIGLVSNRQLKTIVHLEVGVRSAQGKPSITLECQRVWIKDYQTLAIMDELADELNKARDMSHKPVAATSSSLRLSHHR